MTENMLCICYSGTTASSESYPFHALDILLFHGQVLPLFDRRVWRYQGNSRIQFTFRLFPLSVSLIAVCRSSSSGLIIGFLVFMLTTTAFWAHINSEHWLVVEQRSPWGDSVFLTGEGTWRCERLGQSLLRFCLNRSQMCVMKGDKETVWELCHVQGGPRPIH